LPNCRFAGAVLSRQVRLFNSLATAPLLTATVVTGNINEAAKKRRHC